MRWFSCFRLVEGLRVVDASVMPTGLTGSTAGAVFMIAERAAEIAAARHRAGTVAYVEVLIANRTALVLKRSQQVLAGRRLIASVALVKALGGGWQQTMPVVVPEQTADPASLPPAKVPLLKRVFGRKGQVER